MRPKILLAGLLGAWFLLALVVIRYPGDSATFRTHLYFGAVGSVALLFAAGVSPGFAVGLVTGCLWIIEISFNNSIDPRNPDHSGRYTVDNIFWALVALIILAASFWEATRTESSTSAIYLGG